MNKELDVKVTSPQGIAWYGFAKSVILPTTDGEIGILTGHITLTAYLDIGVVQIKTNKGMNLICIHGGFAQIEQDQVNIITNFAQKGEDIKQKSSIRALETAENKLKQANSNSQKNIARMEIRKAKALIKAMNSK